MKDSFSLQTVIGDMFELAASGDAICITTNGIVKSNNQAVMGLGTAKLARDKFPGIDTRLGGLLRSYGNRVFNVGMWEVDGKQLRVLSYPTKWHYREPSSVALIQQSAQQLNSVIERFALERVWLPFPGGGAGGLTWKEVQPLLTVLPPNVIITSINPNDFQ